MNRIFASLVAQFRGLSARHRLLLVLFALCGGLVTIGRFTERHGPPSFQAEVHTNVATPRAPQDADLRAEWQRVKENSKAMLPAPAAVAGTSMGVLAGYGAYERPLIVSAAELSMSTKDFSHARSALQEVLERHHGYASRLRMTGQPSGSTLTATLRVPSTEFAATVTDLKALGNVEKEEQTADEITQQHADVEARLANAQNTLRRLEAILANTKPWDNSAEVQRQFANVRAEIARLEAERIAAEHRTVFANVLFSLREEITPPVESFGAQFRKAAMAGVADALSSLSAIVLFLISYGPAVLVWALLLFVPSRWIWKKWHSTIDTAAAQTAQNS